LVTGGAGTKGGIHTRRGRSRASGERTARRVAGQGAAGLVRSLL